MEFLEEVTQAAVEAGATTINLPDTVGYATPGPYGEIFSHLLAKLPILRERGVVLSSHCHNDLGMAVANSLAAVQGGARQVECTINGIGERAGNAALEEIVMALRTRRDYFKIGTRIDTTKIYPASRLVSTLTGLTVQRNKAIVGRERLRPRERHPPGRRPQAPRDVRDHGPGHGRPGQEQPGPGQAQRPGRLPRPGGAPWGTPRPTPRSSRPSPGSRRWPTRRRRSSTRTSRPSSTTSWRSARPCGRWPACR